MRVCSRALNPLVDARAAEAVAIPLELGTVEAIVHVEPAQSRNFANLHYLRRCTEPIL